MDGYRMNDFRIKIIAASSIIIVVVISRMLGYDDFIGYIGSMAAGFLFGTGK